MHGVSVKDKNYKLEMKPNEKTTVRKNFAYQKRPSVGLNSLLWSISPRWRRNKTLYTYIHKANIHTLVRTNSRILTCLWDSRKLEINYRFKKKSDIHSCFTELSNIIHFLTRHSSDVANYFFLGTGVDAVRIIAHPAVNTPHRRMLASILDTIALRLSSTNFTGSFETFGAGLSCTIFIFAKYSRSGGWSRLKTGKYSPTFSLVHHAWLFLKN